MPVSAFALLTDPSPSWRPRRHELRCMETRLVYEFPIFKLSDHKESDFAGSDNPWAWVMKAALLGLHKKWDDETLIKVKLRIYREFRERGFSVKMAREFLNFLSYYVNFEKPESLGKFENETIYSDHKNNRPMGIIEAVKEHKLEQAEKRGIEKGMEKGMEKEQLRLLKSIMTKHPGFTDEQVADLVSLPIKTVKRIRAELQNGS